MESDLDLYDGVVATYIRVIRQDSAEAAAAIEDIFAACGSRAALRATLVMTLLKMEVLKNHSVENFTIQTYLVGDFPQAIPLLERAITCWLRDWNVRHLAALGLANGRSKDTP